eukprot:scaffold529483_cov15-Prasinocladus_malaysianus.AAC.1
MYFHGDLAKTSHKVVVLGGRLEPVLCFSHCMNRYLHAREGTKTIYVFEWAAGVLLFQDGQAKSVASSVAFAIDEKTSNSSNNLIATLYLRGSVRACVCVGVGGLVRGYVK